MAADKRRASRASSEPRKKVKIEQTDLYISILRLLNDIVNEGRAAVSQFLKLPSKKLYPDYYQSISSPISINEIKEKAVNEQYETVDDFVADFELLASNALTYNERDSEIAKDAEFIRQFVSEQIQEWKDSQPKDFTPYYTRLREGFMTLIEDLVNYKSRGRVLSGIFMEEPRKRDYPDYYQIISHATSLTTLKKLVNTGTIKTIDAFSKESQLIFANAMLYNEEGSQVYSDASILDRYLSTRLDKFVVEYSEPKGYPAWAAEANVIRLPGRPGRGGTKIKISLRKPGEQEESKSALENDGDGEDEEHNDESEEGDEENKTGIESDNGDEQEGESPGQIAASVADGEEGDEAIKNEERLTEPPPVPQEIRRREEGKTAADGLLREVRVSSMIPVTSRYQQAKNLTPPTLQDLFQLVMPASEAYIIRSYSLNLPNYHHTVNISAVLNETLNHRYYNLDITHNGRKLSPIGSSASNPWDDLSKPLKTKYEVRLSQGLNHVDISLQAAVNTSRGSSLPVRHASQSSQPILNDAEEEKITLWINLQR